MIIKKKDTDIVIANKVKIADSFLSRGIGLLGKKCIDENEGMLFTKSTQIHTFFMRFSIDIIFMDKNKKIIKIYRDLKPFKITSLISKSYSGFVLELKAGTAEKLEIKEGDFLDFIY